MKRRLYQLTIIIVSLLIIQGLSRSLIELSAQKNRIKKVQNNLTELNQQELELKEELEYYQSDQYVETIARNKLILSMSGETVIFLPKQESMNNEPFDKAQGKQETMSNEDEEEAILPNWKKWLLLFDIGYE